MHAEDNHSFLQLTIMYLSYVNYASAFLPKFCEDLHPAFEHLVLTMWKYILNRVTLYLYFNRLR